MDTPARTRPSRGRQPDGFTLIEVMVTLVVVGMVAAAILGVLVVSQRSKSTTSNEVETSQAARVALEMISRDLRSAGYGVDRDYTAQPQPAIAYVDSSEILINENLQPFPDTTAVHQVPLAYDPGITPNPKPLVGTEWTPPTAYATGAELVRYTLDVDNDGAIDAADVNAAEGIDAKRTRNPDDFVLLRQVYGRDGAGNGGAAQRIALVKKPGGSVPAMFTVYMQGSSTPYDWANGPVPAAQLASIERIEVSITAASPKPDWRGRYTQTVFSSTVNSMRNAPSFGPPTYSVSGWVFNDLNGDGARQTGELGLANAFVRLGTLYTTYTNASGFFQFSVPAGTYTLRHTPPQGYYCVTSPDSFSVSVPVPQQRSFADRAMPGGFIHVLAFEDADGNGVRDASEGGVSTVRVTVTPGNLTSWTDINGLDSVFVGVGAYTVGITPPDSFVVSGANPRSGTMVNGGNDSYTFALTRNAVGRVTGRVFTDIDRDGVYDAGESGIEGVWVGVTDDGGIDIAGWSTTASDGTYTITVPINDPPHTRPYTVYCIPPSGTFPTGSPTLGNIWLTASSTVSGKDFGMARFQVISLDASRVLSLGSTDLIEQDWNGNINQWQTKGVRDADIVLGADAGGTDNVSVWLNRYNSSTLFSTTPSAPDGYTRNAPQSVLAIALDTLDTGSPIQRPDLVTGTRKSAAGNFFLWLNQNTSGNLGYFPTSYTTGGNYTTQDLGDVTSILTADVAGGTMPDLIVGTRSPTAGRGTVEIWQNSNTATPTFTRQEIYPTAGAIPGARLGEVTCMALADLDGDGDRDLLVGTKTGTYSGEVDVFRYDSKVNGARYTYVTSLSSPGAAVTAITTCDVNVDGLIDVVVGTQESSNTGYVQYWRNRGAFDIRLARQVAAPGLVLSLSSADFGGASGRDIAMGWRQDESSYIGGVRIFYTDLGTLPSFSVDPSGGEVVNMVPASTTNNFNYGVQPTVPSGTPMSDLAVGVKVTALTGALVIFIR